MKYHLPLGVYAAAAGFVLMVFEMAAARVLAPTIGSSTYIWTSVIGVIVAALSVGYWYGGRVADLRARTGDIGLLFALLGLLIAGTLVLYESTLGVLAGWDVDSRWQAVTASLILFAPASFVAGMISPYLAKLNVTSLGSSGRSIADLGALNSIGGITGTFLTGFVLFGFMGVREIVIGLVIVCLVLAWTVAKPTLRRVLIAATVVSVILVLMALRPDRVIAIDTPSAHYTIDTKQTALGTYRTLATGPGASQSGVMLERPYELVFWYAERMAEIIASLERDDLRILMLGGGAYTLPQHLAHEYPRAQIDVVEIDPQLIEIGRQYFAYADPVNVTPYHQDARTFVNATTNRYDVVLVDVFSHDATPFQFATEEYGQAIRRITKPHGLVAVNIVAGDLGECRELLNASVAPYHTYFDKGGTLFRFREAKSGNVMALFAPNDYPMPQEYEPITTSTLYDDNFAPTERLVSNCRQQ